MNVSPTDKPRDVRRKIEGLIGGRSLSNQRLVHRKHELSEDETLEDAKVKDGSEIKMKDNHGKGKLV